MPSATPTTGFERLAVTKHGLCLLALACLVAIVLAGAWWAYHPGLGGGFQFDDFANLPALGATGPINNWATFWRYITSGTADPTGRPLAMLSFLLDARNWPANPRPFLRTSIELHLINGVLLFWLLRQLGFAFRAVTSASDTQPVGNTLAWRINLAALLGAAIWLLHPLFVSTTLYIVQREAMLPATFTLLGLIAWLRGRRSMRIGRTWRGLTWLVLGLGVCTVLGILSKANGILLPALALVIEWTVLRQRPNTNAPEHDTPRRTYRWAMWILAGLPALFVAAYLIHAGYDGFVHGVAARRPWTLGQRLLTEPRVLMDYLQLLWLPRPFTPGLFNDQIHASTSLLAPWSTLPCLLAVIGLIVGACLLRRRWPALAMAVLFYFVGQAIESSTIALELYYEHRNYLPAMVMFWPLALWLCGVHQRGQSESVPPGPSRHMWAKLALAVIVLGGLATMTHARANVWGHTRIQAKLWARLNPDSPRAQANAAISALHSGHPALAADHLRSLLKHDPSQVQLALNLFAADCAMGDVPATTRQASKTALATTRNPGALLVHWFGRAIDSTAHPTCPQMNLHTLGALLDAAHRNPKLMASPGRRQDIAFLRGRIALATHDPDAALTDFDRALKQNVRTTAALKQAALLGSHGYPRRGLEHLAYYRTLAAQHLATLAFGMPRIHAWVLHHQHYWQNQMTHLEHTLHEDAAHDASANADHGQ